MSDFGFLREPKPVEVPGRIFCAVSVLVFFWHQWSNGGKVDWISLTLLVAAFLPWLGSIVESITIKDLSVKFPALEGEVPPQPVNANPTEEGKFAALSIPAKKVFATLARHRKSHGDSWGFSVNPKNPVYLSFQAGVFELAQRNWIRQAPNGLIALSREGVAVCKEEDNTIARHKDIYSHFVPLEQ